MRIAIFTPTFLPKCSGAEIFHHNLALRLSERGHEPIVLLPRSLKRRLDDVLPTLPYQTVGFPSHQWSLLRRWPLAGWAMSRWTLGRFQARYRFDVWHSVVLSPAGACFADWQSRTHRPGLIRAVGDDVPLEGDANLAPRFQKAVCKAQCIVSLSEGMTQAFIRMGVPDTRIVEIPNAVDIKRFEGHFNRKAFLERHGLSGAVCLCVARNHPQKDLPTLFKAFREVLKSSMSPVHLVVVGRGMPSFPLDPELQSHVRLIEIEPSGLMEFPAAEIVNWYRAADLFVLTSRLEGFSTALLEAMAAGLPIVGTDVPGIRERVANGIHGILCPSGDAQGIALAIQQLLTNPEKCAALGNEAKIQAGQFSWDRTLEAYESLYKKLVLSGYCQS